MLNRTQRRCKICRAKFTAAFENQRWCCPEHGAELAIQELEKKREKQVQAKAKKERAAWRKRKAAVKPLKHWEDMTQRVVNDYIRERDFDLPCISCGTFETVQWEDGCSLPRFQRRWQGASHPDRSCAGRAGQSHLRRSR